MKRLVWLLTLALAACTSPMTATPALTLEATLLRPTEIVNSPSATPVPPTATVTPLPPTATAVPPTPTSIPRSLPTPIGDWSDLTPYRAAMRPEFAADIDQFAEATQYLIDLTIAPDLASYTAMQQVHFVNQQATPLDKIYFRLFPNARTYGGQLPINELRVNNAPVDPRLEVDDTALRIDLNPPLKPQEAIDFTISYAAQVPTTLNDAGYNLFGVYSHTLSLANFYPLIPAHDEQGWHIEPAPQYGDAGYSETALYQVNIQTPADQVVATSGVCEAADDGTTKTWHCVSGPMRDFMLAMSADYQVESRDIGDVKVNSYFWESDEAGGRQILQTGASALTSFEKRVGAYPFTEMDLLETPTTAGGCEYPGLMVFAADFYSDETIFAAHEVAHQWWYSLVGNDQVNEPWLDEALATFSTYLWMLDENGEETFQNVISAYQSRYDQTKGTADDKRVDLPTAGYASAQQYSRNVYLKGMLFFNALYEKMGDKKFNQFLQAYFKANRYGIAHPADLLKALETQIDRQTLTTLLKEWITTPE
ncbi:Aminopeptidase N [Thermoflexales bacterium]|nr:Aminopeptidase N [Thermoflexales bacterium]